MTSLISLHVGFISPAVDFISKLGGSGEQQQQQQGVEGQQQQQSGGGFMDKINSVAGGGQQGEKNEDYLDKGVDYVQQNFLGGGDQSNENAIEQGKDEAISDAIRAQYKTATGSDFPIADK